MPIIFAKCMGLVSLGGWTLLTAMACLLFAPGDAVGAPPNGVSRTAFGALAYRAVGAQNPDPATRNPDHLAARLCNPIVIYDRMGLSLDFAQAMNVIEQRGHYLFYYVTARTAYMDQVLEQALEQGAGQVVILGAGFDSRAHRFHAGHPEVRFFEVDLPPMVAIKQRMVQKRLCQTNPTLKYVPIDFETQRLDQEMEKAGFSRDVKTLFIWEGVTMYLDAQAVAATLRVIAGNSAPGSQVAFDYVNPGAAKENGGPPGRDRAERFSKLGEPIKWGVDPDRLGDFLADQGLQLTSTLGPERIAELYLTGSDGKPLGRMPKSSWFAVAQVPGAEQGANPGGGR